MRILQTLKILKYITNHPLNRKARFLAVLRFLKWQITSRINSNPIIIPFAEKSKLLVKRGLAGATGNLYCGLHEFEDMSFTLHFLRESDLFVDIGANIGSYTILSASEKNVETVSFEPGELAFEIFMNNVSINHVEEKVTAHNIALGSEKRKVSFTTSLDTTNHVAIDSDTTTETIMMDSFDHIIKINRPTLIKIDVEGFEMEVINGMEKALNNNNLKAILIELNGSGKRYGINESDIHEKFLIQGFKPYKYLPFQRLLKEVDFYGENNTLYIRDYSFVKTRVEESKPYRIHKQEV